MNENLIIRGARTNNLKNIDLTIPRNKLVVMTGLSGSGKSSLAFDTIYAEGQRRYVESLSSYARLFLGQMEKPDLDSIEGLSPAISIDQKTTGRNPRSTVGTVTEIHDYMRLLWARVGTPHCPKCGREIRQQSVDEMVDAAMSLPEGSRVNLLAPLVRGKKGEFRDLLERARKSGFVRVRLDGEMYELEDAPVPAKTKKHTIELVVDRLIIRKESEEENRNLRRRLTDSMETAAHQSGGLVTLLLSDGSEQLLSMNYACPDCGIALAEIAPRTFSFNSPFGACPECGGLGTRLRFMPDLIFPDPKLSLRQGALTATGFNAEGERGIAAQYFTAMGKVFGFDLDTPVEKIPEAGLDAILYGTGSQKFTIHYEGAHGDMSYTAGFEGVIPTMERRYRETSSDAAKEMYEAFMAQELCPACQGRRLKPEALAVTVGGMDLAAVSALPVRQCRDFFRSLQLSGSQMMIAGQILKEIDARLGFLSDVGLDYLTLSRSAESLSGGEAQRIRLATQIGSALMGVLYVLDEPSIGLHQRDNKRLIDTLKRMRDLGNTVIVVEHDEETMYAADMIVDIGPGAGEKGGYVVAQGTIDDIKACPESLTGQYLTGQRSIPVPQKRRQPAGWLNIRGAAANNLKNLDVDLPLGVMCCVTGVSGSGKSSLVNAILYRHLAKVLNRAKTRPAPFREMLGLEQLDKVILIDQSPIGRTPRSNPATYTGLFDQIRRLFAQTPEAKARGYKENRFSFNVKGGRCEHCQGDGLKKIEMHFLPDVYVPCEVCGGKRYNRETLEVTFKDKNIADVLEMSVDEAVPFFENFPAIRKKVETLQDVGLGYIRLGQSSTTLSGGEAQRVKLATELSRKATGRTIYVLDEPTTGLHMADVDRLVTVLQRLTDGGNSMVIIEHNMDVIKAADWIIDLGPEGGDGGGTLVCSGTPEEVAACAESWTGKYLKPVLEKARTSSKPRKKAKG